VRGIISEYRLDQLVNQDRTQVALSEIEDRAQAMLRESLAEAGYGLAVESVGIYRIILPESTTAKVFETMIATRERLAENALQEGQAQASAIRSEAESGRDRILAFADRRAQAIRSEGDREAAREYAGFARNEEFAIFLRRLEALEKMLGHNTTFVLSAESLGILDWFDRLPEMPAAGASP
jgi:membrane protease subunit HflC